MIELSVNGIGGNHNKVVQINQIWSCAIRFLASKRACNSYTEFTNKTYNKALMFVLNSDIASCYSSRPLGFLFSHNSSHIQWKPSFWYVSGACLPSKLCNCDLKYYSDTCLVVSGKIMATAVRPLLACAFQIISNHVLWVVRTFSALYLCACACIQKVYHQNRWRSKLGPRFVLKTSSGMRETCPT